VCCGNWTQSTEACFATRTSAEESSRSLGRNAGNSDMVSRPAPTAQSLPTYLHRRKSSEAEVMLRPTLSRPVCHGVGHLSGEHDWIFITVWQFRGSSCGARSMTRGWVCDLLVQVLLGHASAVTVGSKSHRTHEH
jgi:hypothetical protein